MKERDRSYTLSEKEDYNSELVSCSKKIAKVKRYRPFKKYDPQYFKYEFISGGGATNPETMCAIYDAMKWSKLICHLHSIHPDYKDKVINSFLSNLYLFGFYDFAV